MDSRFKWLNQAQPYQFHSEPAHQSEEQWTEFNTRVNLQENPERTFDLVLKVKCQASENEGPSIMESKLNFWEVFHRICPN
ncbi:hypothetical protein BTVI_108880 [Pitangus sulphuratus]|nr:hypothetical protein BTVI_108880 [Pitangus sulphuratus]